MQLEVSLKYLMDISGSSLGSHGGAQLKCKFTLQSIRHGCRANEIYIWHFQSCNCLTRECYGLHLLKCFCVFSSVI